MGWPCFRSASGMFAEVRTEGVAAIMRITCGSLMRRLRGRPNRILNTFEDREKSPLLVRWSRPHVVMQVFYVLRSLVMLTYGQKNSPK